MSEEVVKTSVIPDGCDDDQYRDIVGHFRVPQKLAQQEAGDADHGYHYRCDRTSSLVVEEDA